MKNALEAEELILFSKFCHHCAKENGWWEDPNRNFGEVIALIHSEVSEAYEADMSNFHDDKLTHHLGAKVELADVIIRIGDWIGHELEIGSLDEQDLRMCASASDGFPSTFIAEYGSPERVASNRTYLRIHSMLSNALEEYRNHTQDSTNRMLFRIVVRLALTFPWLLEIAREKLYFNKSRGYRHGGKAM